MFTVGSLSLAAPWALAFLALLPVLWWLLKVIPPSPRRTVFPALRLLFGLETRAQSASRTPLWLVLLRIAIAALVIVAVAHPILDLRRSDFDGPLLLAVDDGWAAVKRWPERHRLIDDLIARAERDGRAVVLLSTAPPADGGRITASGLLAAGDARSLADALVPKPWPTDRSLALAALSAIPRLRPMGVVWIADGLGGDHGTEFARRLSEFGGLEIIAPPATALPDLLLPPDRGAADLTPRVRRAPGGAAADVWLRALDSSGHTLARASLSLAAGAERGELHIPMPVELRNRVTRIEIEGEESAAATVLLDGRWQRHPVGLVDANAERSASPLLDDLYYVARAASPFAELRRGSVSDLLQRDLSLIVLPDQGSLSAEDEDALRAWVSAGGVLFRLAGPKLARNPDSLLPVTLRGGGRTLGGAMSWTQPMALAPMPEDSPFAGLAVPGDVRVNAQVLAEPGLDLNTKTWARLADGTPLVTGAPLGKGRLVLLHTTAWPEWSNLALSGLLPEMIQRLLAVSRGAAGGVAEKPLPPVELLDGFGRLDAPGAAAEALPPKVTQPPPGPRHPPGYYGDETARVAVNLAPALPPPVPLVAPPGVPVRDLGGERGEHDLQPDILLVALLLLLADAAAVLALRGIGRGRVAAASVLLAAVLLHPGSVRADNDKMAMEAALRTRLAYVITGDARVDEVSRAGLIGLTRELANRTTANFGDPVGVDIASDPLMVFPLLYWPVTTTQGALSASAREAVNDYMRHGGMIMFDTRDAGQGGTDTLRGLAEGLDIPPLAQVTSDHVLTRSFYLLRESPGRFTGAPLFVQEGGDPANDNVSPVVIGGDDYAGAWAIGPDGEPMYPAVPGGEAQREMAYRFGINLVMYALTGSYKSDQVHLPIILERLRR